MATTLGAALRHETGKKATKQVRRAGRVPAVTYGQGEPSLHLSVDAHELRLLLGHHGHGLVMLQLEGAELPVIIKEVQREPVKHRVNNVDFLRVNLNEETTATVELHLIGEPTGVKVDGGVLVQALHQVEIAALPQALPERLEANVEALEMNGPPLHVRDIPLPAGVRLLTDADDVVAVVNPPRVEVVEAPVEAAGEPELVGKTESEDSAGS